MKQPIHGGNLHWAARQIGCHPSLILDFSASINPLGPPDTAIAAIQEQLTALTHYPDPDYTQLRLILAQEHQIPPDWILPGNGAAELLTWAGRELSQQDLTYLFVPAFSDYWRTLKAFGAKVETRLLNWQNEPFCLNLEGVDGKNAGILLNNPHNPTGKLLSCDQLLPLLDQFNLVVIDEAFMDFLPPNEQQSLINKVLDYPNLIILRSLTKFYSIPGLRLGYAIANPSHLQQWQQWRDPWSVNVLAVAAGIAALQDRAFQEKTWQWLIEARQQLWVGLATFSQLYPFSSSANFLLVETQQSSSQLQTLLLKQSHILIRDCLSFPELGDRYFRVAVRTQQENQQLLEGLTMIFCN
ncbi:threonine-phosphate decarboxylase CobD [Aphanothece sacrum]|uniref:threonine-phosphate decarboxylase CobD n=1 Tax=Aphanothece sacrum TaxID=1122 RepID=UPI000F608FE7|nr:threonine-phosphate decarboxylase CobD [Aphanothece sacrum]